jgi:hypothetical protein
MNFLSNIDDLIKNAVNETFYTDEMLRQDKQAASVKSAKLVADKKQEKPKDDKEKLEKEPDEVEEADDENSSEESKKIKDEPNKDVKTKDKNSEKPGTQTSKKLKDVETSELKTPDYKDIAKNINLLRGGKSIKNPDVKKNLVNYIERLKPEEKQHFLVYLNSLAQVMAGVKSGLDAAVRPKISADEEKTSKNNNTQDISSKDKETPKKKSNSNVIVVGK